MSINKVKKEYRQVYDDYINEPQKLLVDGFASHQPVLVEMLKANPKSKFLELGVGFGSTPIICAMTKYSQHYDTDLDWLNKLKSEFENKSHSFAHITNHEKYHWNHPEVFMNEWDIALVDNAIGESRQSNLLKLADKCRFIICHDTEELYKPSASDYGWNFASFRYHYVFTKYNTYTTVVSNYSDIPINLV